MINQMNTHTRMFFPTFSLEYVSHDLGYYFAFINFITWNFDQGCYKTLPLAGASSLVLNGTYNQQDYWEEKHTAHGGL